MKKSSNTCDNARPCQNGGTCIHTLNNSTCECRPTYTGTFCTTPAFPIRYHYDPNVFTEIRDSCVMCMAPLDSNSLSMGYNDRKIQIWNLKTQHILNISTEDEVAKLAPLEKGYLASIIGKYTCKIWNTNTGSLEYTFDMKPGLVESLAYVGDNLLASSSIIDIHIWSIKDGTLKKTLRGHGSINAIVSLGNGLLASSGAWDKSVRVWNISTGRLRNTFDDTNGGHSERVSSLAMLGEGDLLASGSDDRTVKIWDIRKGALKYTFDNKTGGHTSAVHFVIRVGEHFVASASADSEMKIWDLRNGRLKFTFEYSKDKQIASSMTMMGDELLVVGLFDGTIKMWDTKAFF